MTNDLKIFSPKITIITVVFNAVQEIEATLKNIFDQNYINKEIIVIDGGSTDGTFEVISKFKHNIDYFISEKDSGIYDAMNKGIKLANGEWICFMNAGDVFNSSKILKNIFFETKIDEDILVGDCVVDYKLFTKRIDTKEISLLIYGMTFCHQSVFVKTKIYREKYFDLRFKIAADFNFFLWCFTTGKKFKKFNFPFSLISIGGLSDKMRISVLIENRQIVRERSKSNIKVELIYFFKITWAFLKYLVEKMLPNSLALLIKKYK
jgi:glycosyltransferase involved in cell wall biosynthesis